MLPPIEALSQAVIVNAAGATVGVVVGYAVARLLRVLRRSLRTWRVAR